MNAYPLSLERYFFTKVELETHVDAEQSAPNEIQTEVEVGQAKDKPSRFQVVLRLKLLPPAKGSASYTGQFHVVGFFRVADQWPKAKTQQLVQANGAALLYGAIREMVANLSARGPWPPLHLPTVTFIEPEASEAATGPKAKPPAKLTKKSAR